jgi:hypothetical protein
MARRKDGVGEVVAVPFRGWKEIKEASFWALRMARDRDNDNQEAVRVERRTDTCDVSISSDGGELGMPQ